MTISSLDVENGISALPGRRVTTHIVETSRRVVPVAQAVHIVICRHSDSKIMRG